MKKKIYTIVQKKKINEIRLIIIGEKVELSLWGQIITV